MQANRYKKKTWKFVLTLCLTACGSALGVSAQMNNSNGAFTINSTATASSTNFRNWLSFSQALQNVTRNDGGPLFGGAGISSPIEVNVQTSITETLPVSFPDIAGTSSTNNIRINGGGNFVAFASTSTTANKRFGKIAADGTRTSTFVFQFSVPSLLDGTQPNCKSIFQLFNYIRLL